MGESNAIETAPITKEYSAEQRTLHIQDGERKNTICGKTFSEMRDGHVWILASQVAVQSPASKRCGNCFAALSE